MILLYPDAEIDFADNGLGALSDAISCTVTEARNGEFEAQLEYPISGIHYSDIAPRCILTVKPNPYADPQPFRIYRITRPLGGRVTVYAQHISYDLSGVTVSPFTASSVTGAFAEITANSTDNNNFAFWTDIQDAGEMAVSVPSSVRAVLGGTEGSILDTYGGEYEWDGYTVRLWSQRGQTNGMTIRYGKNLTSLEQDENIANVATGVYPYWAGEDGALVTLPEKTVDAPGTYEFERYIPLDLSGEFEEQPTVSQLRTRAQQYVEDNNIGVPTVSLSVAFQPLDQTEEYKDIALLERVNLCDTVTVEYPALGVSATAKCVKTVYDALKDRYTSIELGDAITNLVDTVIQQQQEIEKVPTTSAMQQAILHATNLITGNKGGYVVLRDTNGDKEPDEILIMDKADIAQAQKVWRWNSGGLGYSSTGYNGPYGTAITQDGAIVADYITAGILQGIKIIADDGQIAGWDISSRAIYKDITIDGTIYRVYFQPPLADQPDSTWVLSCQKSTDGQTFTGAFVLYANGDAKFGSTTIRADGSIQLGNSILHANGSLTVIQDDNNYATYTSQGLNMYSNGQNVGYIYVASNGNCVLHVDDIDYRNGATGSFSSSDGKNVTVVGGLVTEIE